MLASIAGAIALIPGGGSAAAAAINAVGWLLRCGTCLKILAVLIAMGWTALHVHQADVARCDARIEADHKKAAELAQQRDTEISDALEQKYRPVISTLKSEKATLQQRVDGYAKKKPVKPGAKPAACKLGDAAGLLHRREAR